MCVLLIIIISTLLAVQRLAVRVGLLLYSNIDIATRLFSGWARCRVGTGWAGWEHSRILHIGLRYISGAVRCTIVLILRVRIVIVGYRRRELRALSTGGLRLRSVLR